MGEFNLFYFHSSFSITPMKTFIVENIERVLRNLIIHNFGAKVSIQTQITSVFDYETQSLVECVFLINWKEIFQEGEIGREEVAFIKFSFCNQQW